MESTITASSQPQGTVGVDTHKQFHVAHAVDELGRPLGTHQIPAASGGYRAFVPWARSLGQLVMVGIEGPGRYGAGLARHLRAEGIAVTEVGRPKRQRRARYGKSDDADAAGAAAMVLAGEASATPKAPTAPRRWCASCERPCQCGARPRQGLHRPAGPSRHPARGAA